jgi:hypothetical protein
MSFFGFDPDPGHRSNAPGFGQPKDPFADLSGRAVPDDDV